MVNSHSVYIRELLARLRIIRESKGLTTSDVENHLILGPGWVQDFENAQVIPGLDTLLAITSFLGTDLKELAEGVKVIPEAEHLLRSLYAEQHGHHLAIKFKYDQHDATYLLRNADEDGFNHVIRVMRDGLARLPDISEERGKALKTDAVASAFLVALHLWPKANPSDIWGFIIHTGKPPA